MAVVRVQTWRVAVILMRATAVAVACCVACCVAHHDRVLAEAIGEAAARP